MIPLLLLLQVPADAYELTGRSWAWQADPVEDPFFFNLDSFPSSYRRSEMEDGFIAALDVWNVQGRAPIALRYGGTTDVVQFGGGPDGSNTMFWTPASTDGSVALAARTFLDADIVDCDIQVYGENSLGPVSWGFSQTEASGPDAYSFVYTAVHELGHCIGLTHSNVPGAIMRVNQSTNLGPGDWDLTPDDVAGLQAMYGVLESDLVIAEVVPSPPLESPGTAFDLVVRVENQGAGVATDVIGLISQTGGEAFATIVTGSAAMGDVAAGASTGTAEDALTFRLAVPFTCQETGAVSLDLTVAEASGLSVSQPVSFDVRCPAAPVITEPPPSRCAAVSASGWWALAALLVGWRRRERY